MKKSLIAFVFVFAAALFADEVKIEWEKAKAGDTKLPGWILDNFGASYKDLVGSGKVIAASQEGKLAFQITGKEKNTAFFRQIATPVKLGDTVRVSAKIKGSGDVTMGFYCYNSKKFVGGVPDTYKAFTATSEFQDVTADLVVKTNAAGEEVTMIRTMITGRPNCDIILEDIKFEVIAK